MYINPDNKVENRDEMLAFIKKHSFGILVSQVKNRLWATHIPFMVIEKGEEIYLLAHMSKGNRQWKEMVSQEMMVVFSGPHTNISADWYDHENVPTWNYQTVHAYGQARILEGQEVYDAVYALTDKYEHKTSKAHMDNLSPDFVARELKALVGLEINVSELLGSYKLSQNRDDHNYKEIIYQLKQRGDADSLGVAEAMENLRHIE